MKVLSLFSGIGAFEKALDNLEIPYEMCLKHYSRVCRRQVLFDAIHTR